MSEMFFFSEFLPELFEFLELFDDDKDPFSNAKALKTQ